MTLVVEVEMKNYKPAKPPYTEFYRIIGVKPSKSLEEKIILQPSRRGLRIIVLNPKETQQIAKALREKQEKIKIRKIESIDKHIEKILKKLSGNLGEKIIVKTRTPAKTTLPQTLEIAKKINAEKTEVKKVGKNLYNIKYEITLTQKNLHEALKLIIYGIGKQKHQGYGTTIWKQLKL